MQDKSIDGALLALHKQIIRSNLEGIARRGAAERRKCGAIVIISVRVHHKVSRGKFTAGFFLQ